MTDNGAFKKPPWGKQSQDIHDTVEYRGEYSRMRNARQMIDPYGRTKLELKFNNPEDATHLAERIADEFRGPEQAPHIAESETETISGPSRSREILDSHRNRTPRDGQNGIVEEVTQPLLERPGLIPCDVYRHGDVPGTSQRALRDVRQASQSVNADNRPYHLMSQEIDTDFPSTQTKIKALSAELDKERKKARAYKKCFDRVAGSDSTDMRSMVHLLVDNGSPWAGLRDLLDDAWSHRSEMQRELDVARLELSQATLDAQSSSDIRRLRQANQEQIDEISQLKQTNQDHLEEVSELKQTNQEQSGELERLKAALKMSEEAVRAERLRAKEVTVRLEKVEVELQTRKKAEVEALTELSKFSQHATDFQARFHTTADSASKAHEKVLEHSATLVKANEDSPKRSSTSEEQNASSKASNQVTESRADIGQLQIQVKQVANDEPSIIALETEIGELKSKQESAARDRPRPAEVEREVSELRAELAVYSERELHYVTEISQLQHVCTALLRKTNVGNDDGGDLHTDFSHASKLAIQLQHRYPARKSISTSSIIHGMVVKTADRSQTAWDIAMLVLTKPKMVSVAMIDVFAVELGHAADQQYWLALAILLSFVEGVLKTRKQMPFCTSMVVLRAIEVLVGVGIIDEIAIFGETKDFFDQGCLVQAFYKCLDARMQGHHPHLVSELQPNPSQIVETGKGWLTPDEDNLSLLFSDGTRTVLIRRHQFQIHLGETGWGFVFTDPTIAEVVPSRVVPADPTPLFSLQDALGRYSNSNSPVEAENASLEMRMNEGFF